MNILYIDFNSVIYPSIRLYKDYFNENASAGEIWTYLERAIDIGNHVALDANMIYRIALILKKNPSAKKVFLKNEYKPFVTNICDIRAGYAENPEELNLTYMSFFPHLWNNSEAKNDIAVFSKYDYMSFIGYLFMNEICDSITWAKAPNSDTIQDKDASDIKIASMTSADIQDQEYDMIFMYNSPYFVPHGDQFIFNTFETIFQED